MFLSFDIACIIFLKRLCCHREDNDFLDLCRMQETTLYLCASMQCFF